MASSINDKCAWRWPIAGNDPKRPAVSVRSQVDRLGDLSQSELTSSAYRATVGFHRKKSVHERGVIRFHILRGLYEGKDSPRDIYRVCR
jgi:hypothetical protein